MSVREVSLPTAAVPRPGKCLESIDFDLHETPQYMSYVSANNEARLDWKGGFRWLYLCGVGLGAGVVAVFIQTSLKFVMEVKFGTQEWLSALGYGLWFRFTVWLLISLLLASVAGALVCYVEPLCAGSGIPEIKCYLNGVDQPNVLRLRTLIAKAVGIVCSVAAGLPCGKEGPMIHSGAIVGALAANANAGPLVGPYRPTCEARDLTAAGAAAGVAAAFGAPIGGVLFAVEEGATHINPAIVVRMFVCSSVAALFVRFFAGPREHEVPWGTLGIGVPVEFGRFSSSDQCYFLWELPIFAAMGVTGGLLGAAANSLNQRLTCWRMRRIGSRGTCRFVEALGVTAAIVSFNFFAPFLLAGSTELHQFSPVQRLFVDTGGSSMGSLFHGTEDMHTGMLFFFALVHFAQLIWTYGLGVPSGLFVPALLGGAAFGRLVGQALQGSAYVAAGPGIYALVGATAMMSGMARITISLSVILMETTGEAQWGLPIFLTTVAAKWIGDMFNKGIYDIHIDLKHVPLLEQRPEKQMLALQASDFMTSAVVTLDVVMKVESLVEVLEGCGHHGFPVLDPASKRFLGLVERSTLHHVLRLGRLVGAFTDASLPSKQSPGIVQYEEMLRHGHPGFPSLQEVRGMLTAGECAQMLDLRPYTNMGCFFVPAHTTASRCYRLFRSMGLRHLPVLGEDYLVQGIITRSNLLAAQEGHIKPGSRAPADLSDGKDMKRERQRARTREEKVFSSELACEMSPVIGLMSLEAQRDIRFEV